jgi:hypothetical protein
MFPPALIVSVDLDQDLPYEETSMDIIHLRFAHLRVSAARS